MYRLGLWVRESVRVVQSFSNYTREGRVLVMEAKLRYTCTDSIQMFAFHVFFLIAKTISSLKYIFYYINIDPGIFELPDSMLKSLGPVLFTSSLC